MSSRSAPYLWVQLINAGALPLEALLLLLLLAGADPGPLPQLERLLAWGLGCAAPALLLAQKPADPRSLLVVSCIDEREPSAEVAPAAASARRLPVVQLAFAAGVIALLPLLGWLDHTAALAYQLSPLQGADRLSCLVAASALLALMVWQWQQLVQAIWLLSGQQPAATITRNLGLPLLRLPQLEDPFGDAQQRSLAALTVEPEQGREEAKGTDLDQQIR